MRLLTILLLCAPVGHLNAQSSDSLREKHHYYFLADINLRTVGKLILKDSISPADNYITFNCMDSISSKNKSTRDYFFPVFVNIVKKSDGALAEVIGARVLNYVKIFPKEFSERFTCCSRQELCCSDMIRLAQFAGEETMMADNKQKEFDDLLSKMTLKYKNWRSDKLLLLFIENVELTRRKWRD
jgi:hypothetical protein